MCGEWPSTLTVYCMWLCWHAIHTAIFLVMHVGDRWKNSVSDNGFLLFYVIYLTVRTSKSLTCAYYCIYYIRGISLLLLAMTITNLLNRGLTLKLIIHVRCSSDLRMDWQCLTLTLKTSNETTRACRRTCDQIRDSLPRSAKTSLMWRPFFLLLSPSKKTRVLLRTHQILQKE